MAKKTTGSVRTASGKGQPQFREAHAGEAALHLKELGRAHQDFADAIGREKKAISPPMWAKRVLLRAVILTGPHKVATLADLATDLWESKFKQRWGHLPTQTGEKYTYETFYGMVRGRNPPPRDEDLLEAELAKRAIRALGRRGLDTAGLIQALELPVRTLDDSLTSAFNFAERRSLNILPVVDTALGDKPFWLRPHWQGRLRPAVADEVDKIISHLEAGDQRITYVHGTLYSAKREVLKGVVDQLGGRYLLTASQERLPIFAQAAGAVTSMLFIDRVFGFLRGASPDQSTLHENLDIEGKLAFIEAAAKRAPALFVISDIFPFDEDAVVRRLDGDLIGDVIASLVEGHPETRLLIGTTETDPAKLPWREQSLNIELPASKEEFDAELEGLTADLREVLGSKLPTLSGLTMRLSLPLIQRAKASASFPVPALRFRQALTKNNHEEVFKLVWSQIDVADRLLIGLIASSHDGLKTETLRRLVEALATIEGAESHRTITHGALERLADFENWGREESSFVRWRQESEDGSGAEQTPRIAYVRDPLRALVVKAWITDHKALARDGFWCVARAAAERARDAQVKGGPDALRAALGRNLQALHSLLASLDPKEIDREKTGRASASGAVHASLSVLPPLGETAARPTATLAYRFAWKQLYQLDVEAGGYHLLNAHDDPYARVECLMLFIRPDQPWDRLSTRTLCSGPGAKLEEAALGVAAKGLSRPEQIELLTGIALGAIRARQFHLARDCNRLGLTIARQASAEIRVEDVMRLRRAEIDVGILCGGLADDALEGLCLADDGDDLEEDDRLTLEAVAKRIPVARAEVEGLVGSGKVRAGRLIDFIGGKFDVRLAEIRQMQGRMADARELLAKAVQADQRFAEHPEDSVATIIGGRGVRTLIVQELDGGDSFNHVMFAVDGLRWPTSAMVAPEAVSKARRLVEINRTRVGRGQWSDRPSVFIDDARIAIASHQFAPAQILLERAVHAARRGAGFELLLELGLLRTEVEIEIGMRLAATSAAEPGDDSGLARHITKVKRHTVALASLLGPYSLAPFKASGQMMVGQAGLLESRGAVGEHRLKLMSDAIAELTSAKWEMETIGYRRPLPRLTETIAAAQFALSSVGA